MDFNVKQFCWERTGKLQKNVIVGNIRNPLIPSNLRDLVIVLRLNQR